MAESRLANLDNINLRIATDMEDYMRTANEVHEYSIKNKKRCATQTVAQPPRTQMVLLLRIVKEQSL